MKLEKNNKYYTLSVYTIITVLTIIMITLGVLHYKEVLLFILKIIKSIWCLFMPLLIGMIVAYLLDPFVEFYDKKCKNMHFKTFKIKGFHIGKRPIHKKVAKKENKVRTMPTLLTFLTLIAVLGVFILIITMNIKEVVGSTSIRNISISMNKYVQYFENMLLQVTEVIDNFSLFPNDGGFLQKVYGTLNEWVTLFSAKVFNVITGIGMNAMNILLSFVVAFYLLQDKQRMLLLVDKVMISIFHPSVYRTIKALGADIDYVFSRYIRSQLIDAVVIAILTSLALTLIKLDFAIIIGIVAGVFNLIPYFGPIVGFILAGLIGLLDSNPMKAVYGVVALMIIQQIDAWIIIPKIVGDSVKLHPVVVLLAILIGGDLFGLVGMLIGVPVAAFIRLVILRYAKDVFDTSEE